MFAAHHSPLPGSHPSTLDRPALQSRTSRAILVVGIIGALVAAYVWVSELRVAMRQARRIEGSVELSQSVKAIQHSLDYAEIRISDDGTIGVWNDGATEITGYTADEMIGQTLAVLEPDEPKSAIFQALCKPHTLDWLIIGKTLPLKAKDGTTFKVLLNSYDADDGERRFRIVQFWPLPQAAAALQPLGNAVQEQTEQSDVDAEEPAQ